MKAYILKVVLFISGVLLLLVSVDAFLSTVSVQRGYDGTGMALTLDKEVLEAQAAANTMPVNLPPAPAEGPRAGAEYENVKVLGGLSTAQFTRLMTQMTLWVSPKQGCNYCHNPNNLASDEKYQKIVSRRMFQMVQDLNSQWKTHFGQEGGGVTCYTCHRGKNVPEYIWFEEAPTQVYRGLAGNRAGQNAPAETVALASLPQDPFSPFLVDKAGIRVIGDTALPTGNRASIKQTEWTYGLMMHMSDGLGVNCTYCHNSRAFAEWDQSPVARTTAWYGIRMVQSINNDYLLPLKDEYPAHRLGPTGDAPKANCTTCHQGVYKPLLGQNVLDPFKASLGGPTPYEPPVGTSTTSVGTSTTTETSAPDEATEPEESKTVPTNGAPRPPVEADGESTTPT